MKFKKKSNEHLPFPSTLTGTSYTHVSDNGATPFRIYATKEGIHIGTLTVSSMDELEDLAKIVSEAWGVHEDILKDAIMIAKTLPN